MPAKSKAQQMAAGAALAAKRGDKKKSELRGASKKMEDSMTEDELEELASGKRKGKPEHKSDETDMPPKRVLSPRKPSEDGWRS